MGVGCLAQPTFFSTMTLIDQHGRVVRDLRISVTPRCNFRCTYCDPLGMGYKDPLGTVSVQDVAHVVDAAVGLGMTSVRFTGGEPLLRKELPEMIAYARAAGVEDIAITTNATLLKAPFARTFRRRTPGRVNISLDAVDEAVFKRATGGGSSKPVWESIYELLSLGLHPVKINAVVMRGVNDSEITRLAALTETLPLHVRFIEYMHLNNADSVSYHGSFVPGREIRARVEEEFGELETVPTDPSAPARLFKVPGWQGAVGFINPVSEPFCGACSRMRLTSDAKLRPCLLNDREFDLRPALLHSEPIAAIQEMFLVAAHRKVASGITTPTQRPRTMVAIGG